MEEKAVTCPNYGTAKGTIRMESATSGKEKTNVFYAGNVTIGFGSLENWWI